VPRSSSHLSLAAAKNIIAAAHYAQLIGRPLNRFTTLHFKAAKVGDPVRAVGQLLKLAGDWLRTKGQPLCAIWVREAGEDKGEHLHLLWHVPTDLTAFFAKRERGWRTKIGMKSAKGASLTRPVGLSYRHAERGSEYGESYADHLATTVGYVLKGADQKSVAMLGLSRCEPQGLITGKRSGMTESLNRKARSEKHLAHAPGRTEQLVCVDLTSRIAAAQDGGGREELSSPTADTDGPPQQP
jgi:hypothetical protein